jgi:spore coat polysaccharide biosynthesis protein SpsF (cytidylyltransferase family)
VLHRAAAVENADDVCVAVPVGRDHDHVAELARASGARVVRGSEGDVLARYAVAASSLNADVVMRVTSDCPLLDPELASQVLNIVRLGGADYAANNMPPTWPHGLDCEAFTRETLDEAARVAIDPYDREHVTPWMRRNTGIRRVNVLGPGGDIAQYRWTLDVADDLVMLRALFDRLPRWPAIPRFQEVLDVLHEFPELTELNDAHHGESRPRGLPGPEA